jgi:hypothetical protein
MALKGRKAKVGEVRKAQGNREKRPIRSDPVLQLASNSKVKMKPPVTLKGRRLELWNMVVSKAYWLTPLDASAVLLWVNLAFEQEASHLTENEQRQLRILCSQLGLDPSSRAGQLLNPPKKRKRQPILADDDLPRVTAEIIDAFQRREIFRCQRLCGLHPWEPAPFPYSITGLGVDRKAGPEDQGLKHGREEAYLRAQAWLTAIEAEIALRSFR